MTPPEEKKLYDRKVADVEMLEPELRCGYVQALCLAKVQMEKEATSFKFRLLDSKNIIEEICFCYPHKSAQLFGSHTTLFEKFI